MIKFLMAFIFVANILVPVGAVMRNGAEYYEVIATVIIQFTFSFLLIGVGGTIYEKAHEQKMRDKSS